MLLLLQHHLARLSHRRQLDVSASPVPVLHSITGLDLCAGNYTFPPAAVVITRKAMLHAHSCAAGLAVVCVDAREFLLAPWNRALELSVHPGIIAGVTILREHNAA